MPSVVVLGGDRPSRFSSVIFPSSPRSIHLSFRTRRQMPRFRAFRCDNYQRKNDISNQATHTRSQTSTLTRNSLPASVPRDNHVLKRGHRSYSDRRSSPPELSRYIPPATFFL